jgi:DNA polymerase-3 subunit alpha
LKGLILDKKKKEDFVHLHTHSDMSQLDGCGTIKSYVQEAKKRGNPAIAFTDHGTMRGYMAQRKECESEDIKPIYGIEFYVCQNMHRKGITADEKEELIKGVSKAKSKELISFFEQKNDLRTRWHLTVHAETNEGLENLFKLSSLSYIDGFYYKPRIDLETLIEHNKGLIVSSGCLGSPINSCYVEGRKHFAVEYADKLSEVFGDRFYLEMQPHPIENQKIVNKLAVGLRKRYKKHKLVATQDAHYVEKAHSDQHQVLLCIGTNDKLCNPFRFKFTGDEFHMRTRKEMFQSFRKYHPFLSVEMIKEALNSTMEFFERCNVKIEVDKTKVLLPDPEIPDKYKGDHYLYLKSLCLDGWTWRQIPNRAKNYSDIKKISLEDSMNLYKKRLIYELKILKVKRIIPYFLIIYDLYSWARNSGIMTGPGRGSVAGSLISYLLGITSIDPIEHGLIFERFINPDRTDTPDIDMDFEDDRRREIFSYLEKKYGKDYICQISTTGKLSGKQCLKDVSRVLEVPYLEANKITSSIIERASGDDRAFNTIEDSFKEFEICKKFDKRYPGVLKHSKVLEGMTKNIGIHAAGAIVSPFKLSNIIPLEVRKYKGEDVVVSACDMRGVAENGLVKLDVLGLKTLTVLKDAITMVEERHGKKIDLESFQLDIHDMKVLDKFSEQDFSGVFQFDTPSMYKVCTGVEFTNFSDIVAMNALNRPGTLRSGLASQFVDRKRNPKKSEKHDFHPVVSDITKDTLGVIVYQEHVIKIFTEIAGFSPGFADSLRKIIGKSIGDETLEKERERFIKGAKKKVGMDKKSAGKLMSAIVHFGSYGFNKSHSAAYGMIAFWCQWVKTYYPLEFYWSLIKNEPDIMKIQKYVKDAKKKGIKFLSANINWSKEEISINKSDCIVGSLIDIKGVGEKATKTIVDNQPYTGFMDFLGRVDRRKVHKGVVGALAKSGALDGVLDNPAWFVGNIDEFWKFAIKNTAANREKCELLLMESKDYECWSKEEKQIVASKINPLAFGSNPLEAYDKFIEENIKIKLKLTSDERFFEKNDKSVCFICGIITGVKLNQIGDYHTGPIPSEETRERMHWGKRYASVNIEDRNGQQLRVKFDWDIYPDMQPIIDLGAGSPIIVLANVNKQYQSLGALFAVDLERLRKKLEKSEELCLWERIVVGDHPVKYIKAKTDKILKKRWTNFYFRKFVGESPFWGVVTNIKEKFDKNGEGMAFFGLVGGNGFAINCVCFSHQWQFVKGIISQKSLMRIDISKMSDKTFGRSNVFDGGKIKKFKGAE